MNDKHCSCAECTSCEGGGVIYINMYGCFVGVHRNDDLYEAEPCPSCGGRGIEQLCEFCAEQEYEADPKRELGIANADFL